MMMVTKMVVVMVMKIIANFSKWVLHEGEDQTAWRQTWGTWRCSKWQDVQRRLIDELLQPVSALVDGGGKWWRTRKRRGKRNECQKRELKLSDKREHGKFCLPGGDPGRYKKTGGRATSKDTQHLGLLIPSLGTQCPTLPGRGGNCLCRAGSAERWFHSPDFSPMNPV